jgi:hypothetical protein
VKNYVAELPKQLSLNANDVVLITHERNGWLQGRIVDMATGKYLQSGWFPATYVSPEPLVLAPSSPSATVANSRQTSLEPAMPEVIPVAPLKSATPEPVAKVEVASELTTRKSSDSMVDVSLRQIALAPTDLSQRPHVIIKLTRTHGLPLGVGVVGGKGTEHGDLPIYVNQIVPESSAAKDGRLAKGDMLVQVNGGLISCAPLSVIMVFSISSGCDACTSRGNNAQLRRRGRVQSRKECLSKAILEFFEQLSQWHTNSISLA